MESFRLLVLRTAWLIDKHKDYQKVRKDIAAIKVAMPKVYHDVATKAAHLHGALGVSNEMPFMRMVTSSPGHGHRRRPDRGAQGHAGEAGAEGLPARQRPRSPATTSPSCQEEAQKRFAKELGEMRAAYADRGGDSLALSLVIARLVPATMNRSEQERSRRRRANLLIRPSWTPDKPRPDLGHG